MSANKNFLLVRTGEALSKPLSFFTAFGPVRKVVGIAELYAAFLDGRGSGQSWNMESEVKCASRYIHNAKPIVFDVGANKGEWAEFMANILPGTKMYLFEPQLLCHEVIQNKNIPNITLVPKGLSSNDGKAAFFTSDTVTSEASLHKRRDSCFEDNSYGTVEIETTSVDSFVQEHEIDFVDFLKMDIEGHEYEALIGAENTLSKGKIGALSFEFGSSNINSRTFFHDFWDLLTGYGYKIGRILPSGKLYPIERYSEDCEYFRGISNYIAYI